MTEAPKVPNQSLEDPWQEQAKPKLLGFALEPQPCLLPGKCEATAKYVNDRKLTPQRIKAASRKHAI